jgi:hypothetical protein
MEKHKLVIAVQANLLGKKQDPISKITPTKWAGRVTQVEKRLPSKHKVLNSILSTTKIGNEKASNCYLVNVSPLTEPLKETQHTRDLGFSIMKKRGDINPMSILETASYKPSSLGNQLLQYHSPDQAGALVLHYHEKSLSRLSE